MDPASLVRQLLLERPTLGDSLRSLTASPAHRAATNEVFAALIDQQRLLQHKRSRAAGCLTPSLGLLGRDGFKRLKHVPDVLQRVLCEIAEIPHVTNASPEWLDEMENLHG